LDKKRISEGGDQMPKRDGTGPPKTATGPRNGQGQGQGQSGQGAGARTGGEKGNCPEKITKR